MIVSEDNIATETGRVNASDEIPSEIDRGKIDKSISKSADPGRGEQDDAAWTIQRARRLVPSFTLSRNDLGTENSSRSKQSSSFSTISTVTSDASVQASSTNSLHPGTLPLFVPPLVIPLKKKAVSRFSKEELLSRRQRTVILPSMADFVDIISIEPLDPVSLSPLQADEIQKIWQKDLKPRKTQNKKDDDDPDAIWDDAGETFSGGNAMDLADMAAAALKFRSDTIYISQEASTEKSVNAAEAEEGVEWDENLTVKSTEKESNPVENQGDLSAAFKKNMLMEALQIQSPTSLMPSILQGDSLTVVENSQGSVSASENPSISSSLFSTFSSSQLNHESVEQPHFNDEWFYTDPQEIIRGPFMTKNMKAWSDSGYFSPDLPIKMRHWLSFHTLSTVFPICVDAFRTQPPEPISANAYHFNRQSHDEQLRNAHEQQRSVSAQEQQRLAEEQHMLIVQEQQRVLAIEQQRLLQAQEQQRIQAIEQQRILQAQEQQRIQAIEHQRILQTQEHQRMLQEQQRILQAQEQQRIHQAQEHQRAQQVQEQRKRVLHAQEQQQRLREQAIMDQLRTQQQHQANLLEQQRRDHDAEQRRQDQRQRDFFDIDHQRNQLFMQDNVQQRDFPEDSKLQDSKLFEQQLSQHRQFEEHRQRQQQQQLQEILASQDRQRRLAEKQVELHRAQQEEANRRLEDQYQRDLQRDHIEQQRRQVDSYGRPLEPVSSAGSMGKLTSIAPWASHLSQEEVKVRDALSLVEIQRRQEEEVHRARQREAAATKESVLKNAGWVKPQAAIQALPSKSLLQIQMEEKQRQEERDAATRHQLALAGQQQISTPSTQLKSLLGVQGQGQVKVVSQGSWPVPGSRSQANSSLSLREIMEQEEANAIAQAMSHQPLSDNSVVYQKAPVGSWAAKAMTSGPSNVPVKVVSRNPNINSAAPTSNQFRNDSMIPDLSRSLWSDKPVSMSDPLESQMHGGDGTLMPREFFEWCAAQLKKMNSQADPSLLNVCLSFQSSGEVREYIAELLGSTPVVSQFASEFVKKKEVLVAVGSQQKKKKK